MHCITAPRKILQLAIVIPLMPGVLPADDEASEDRAIWAIDSTAQWEAALEDGDESLVLADGTLAARQDRALVRSVVRSFETARKLESLVIEQSSAWQNWEQIKSIGPTNLSDAPVLLVRGEQDYWMLGRYGQHGKRAGFKAQPAQVEGFDQPLVTTPFPLQYDAPGGLKPGLGGYHAWQSRDMLHWLHHGPVTEGFSRWVTTAEMDGDRTVIYYDYPNDQNPHVYVDEDLTDGEPGKDMGMAFNDPSHGSDCAVIRDLNGQFHLIYEDWTPINARRHSWDSPLAGRAVSDDGLRDFKIMDPVVDFRTVASGEVATYLHPHWKQHPDWDSNVAEYEVHRPKQDAFGDWAAISVGGRYYLFGDYHPADDHIRIGWLTAPDITGPFELCGSIGKGHPDPDIGFAEGRFYLITQLGNDYVSPGPWVGNVEARVGVDTSGDGEIDQWTDWQEIEENYRRVDGFAKQVRRIPAGIDGGELPEGHAFAFEIRLDDATGNASKPVLDRVTLTFEQ